MRGPWGFLILKQHFRFVFSSQVNRVNRKRDSTAFILFSFEFLNVFACRFFTFYLFTYIRKKFEDELEEFRNEKKLEERRQRYYEHEVYLLSLIFCCLFTLSLKP